MVTVFWSWQSDTPKRETRDLIQVALYAAVQDLKADFQKARREVSVDQDVKGVVGQAIIAETVLEKIDRAFAFVGDVTPVAAVGRGRNRKLIPNPNVMLELGYARRALGLARIIPVFNEAIRDARFEDLPFDLRHLTGTIAYKLPEGASRSELRRVRALLRKRFVIALRAMIEESREQDDVAEAPSWHPSLPHDPSIWHEAYNPLPVNLPRTGQNDIIVAGVPRLYVRLLPSRQGLPPRDYQGVFPGGQDMFVPLGNVRGAISAGRTLNGHAIFESVAEDRTTKSIVRWYKDNGEVWAISGWGFYGHGGPPHLAYDDVIKDLVDWLERVTRSMRVAGGQGPYSVQIGASGLRQVKWWQAHPDPQAKPFLGLSDLVKLEGKIADGGREEVLAMVGAFMDEITDNFGVPSLSPDRIAECANKR